MEDAYAFIEAELREADSCLEPSAPKNGRVIDGWHASACVIRALSVLGRMKRGEFAALAAPAAQPETETAWQTRAEAAEAELALLREALRRETLIVDNVWGALGISTYAEARGKHIAELVSELRIELASLKAELPAPAAPPEKD